MEMGAQFNNVFLFAPAMNRDFTFPYLGARRIFVIHNRKDKAIRMGKLLWWHDFGDMGRKGYDGPPDPRVFNVEDEKTNDDLNHSHYFNNHNIPEWTNFVIKNSIE